MKIEQLLVQYLYNNKKVSLQDIGTFTISSDIVIPLDNEKDTILPPGTIDFNFDGRTPLDEGLVDFIVQQTRKIRPLASSDLESYSILNKQFLNIGKPLIIEGLGVLQKSQQGNYEFTQGNTYNTKMDAAPSQMREKQSEEISFKSTEKREKTAPKRGLLLFVGLVFLVVLGAAIYYFVTNKPKDVVADTNTYTTDTPVVAATVPVVADTIPKAVADTTKVAPAANDGYTFKVVIKEYSNKLSADKAFTRLTSYGHKLVLSPIDSLRYKISIPFTTALSDTTRAKDSLSKFFQSKTYIDHN